VLRIIPDLQELFDFEEEWERGLIKLSDAAREAVRAATVEAPKEAINTRHYKDQTGLLTSMTKGWVEISVPGGAIGEIGAYTHYASYVDGGTAPHEIRGNPLLTFKIGAQWVSVHGVHHPGTKPDGFMGRAYLKAEAVMIREVEIGVDQLQRFLDG
jgi:hypothetical protein